MLELGKYKPTAEAGESYFFVDKHNMMVSNNGGEGDAIGRNLYAWLAYGDNDLVKGVENCWSRSVAGYLAPIRHPNVTERPLSRDHYVHTLVLLRLWEKQDLLRFGFYRRHVLLDDIIEATPSKIINRHRFTLSLIMWAKSLRRNKAALFSYLVLELILVNLFYRPTRWLGYKIAGWGNELDQAEYDKNAPGGLQTQPERNKVIDKLVFPSYALLYSILQWYATDDTFPRLKRLLGKSYSKMVGKTNYVQKLLLGEDVPEDKVKAYKAMKGGRWSTYLNGRTDRNMYIFDPPYTYNNIDVDLLRNLYNKKSK